jgi:hypothetical protein
MVLLRPSHGKVGGHLPLNPLQTTRRIRIRIRLRSEQNPCHSSGNIPFRGRTWAGAGQGRGEGAVLVIDIGAFLGVRESRATFFCALFLFVSVYICPLNLSSTFLPI